MKPTINSSVWVCLLIPSILLLNGCSGEVKQAAAPIDVMGTMAPLNPGDAVDGIEMLGGY